MAVLSCTTAGSLSVVPECCFVDTGYVHFFIQDTCLHLCAVTLYNEVCYRL